MRRQFETRMALLLSRGAPWLTYLAVELCFGAFPNGRRSHGGTTTSLASLAALLTFNVLRLTF